MRFNLIALVYNRQLKSVSCYSSTAASVSAVLNISLKQALLDVHKQKKLNNVHRQVAVIPYLIANKSKWYFVFGKRLYWIYIGLLREILSALHWFPTLYIIINKFIEFDVIRIRYFYYKIHRFWICYIISSK